MSDQPRMVKLTELWERTSAKGTRYFSGFLGAAQILMFDSGPHPDRPDVRIWKLLVQERDPERRPRQEVLPPTRGRSTRELNAVEVFAPERVR